MPKLFKLDLIINNFNWHNLTLGNLTLGNLTLGNLTLGNLTLGNLTLGNLTLGNLTLGNLALGFCLLFSNSALAAEEKISLILFYNQSRFNTDSTSTSPYGSSAYGGETSDFAGSGYGLLYEKPIKNLWSLETGLAYFSRGYSIKDPYSVDKSTYNWNSIFLPLVGRFRPNNVFTGFIGGYGSLAVGSATILSKYSNLANETKTTADFKTLGFTPFEAGLTYGAGVNLSINSSTTMIIEVRINEGLTNFIDPKLNTQNSSNSSSSQNNTEFKAYMRETWLVAGFLI